MEAATPLRKSQVRTIGDRLAIEALVVEDECAVRVVKDREAAGDDPAKAVVDAIEIGARVLDREQAGAQADFVKGEFDKLSRDVGERTRELQEGVVNRFDELFGPDSGELVGILERHFGEDSKGSVPNQVKDALTELRGAVREDILKQFTSGDHNPLQDFKAGMVKTVEEAQQRQAQGLQAIDERMTKLQLELQSLHAEKEKADELAAEREKGTAKGRTYEEGVFAALDAIAGVQGDDTQAVGDTKGATRRTGDIVVEVDGCNGPARGTLVFEAKDSKLSRPEAIRQLDRAMDERGADFAVLVVPTEDEVPANTRPLREYNGDKLIAVWDPETDSRVGLELAYSLARARVLMAASDADEIDTGAIRDTADRAVQALGDVRKIKGQLTGARTSIGNAREMVEELEARVRSYLEQIAATASGQQTLS